MPPRDAAELLNLVGFVTGAALYAMLLALVARSRQRARGERQDALPLFTALLGLAWNVGELLAYGAPRLGLAALAPALTAVSFSALGLLAAVVVHSVARTHRRGVLITGIAYGVSAAAGVLHAYTVIAGNPTASSVAFALLTISFAAIIAPLAVLTRQQPHGRRVLWILALAVFAVSASHLGRAHGGENNWFVELVGHHAAIPVAFAILYQEYRFALADLFLKQALTLLVLVAIAFGCYTVVSMLDPSGALGVGLLLASWVATAVVYPSLRRQIVRFVDTVLLGRADYGAARVEISQGVNASESIESALDTATRTLGAALGHGHVWWEPANAPALRPASVRVEVQTADTPGYVLAIGELEAGRRLLSDDTALAEHAAAVLGRRIDAIRLSNERFRRRLRDEEMLKLAAEAELRALRAQINPHFLFNALTTIGYLIGASPERALRTLMRLTSLLRGVLRSDGEFTTLGREIELIRHYLDIESARFEERLHVTMDVPPDLENATIPALLVQPLVENAVKHGIAPSVQGGAVHLQARADAGGPTLVVTVRNTGAPLPALVSHDGSVGLSNVARRLAAHYGDAASFTLRRDADGATVARIEFPIDAGTSAAGRAHGETAASRNR